MNLDENKLPAPASDEIKLESPVTTVIRQRPRPDAVPRYEAWLKEIIPVAQEFAGHQSVNVIRPHATSDAYTIVLHFDSIANLRKWLDSEVRMRLVDKIRHFLRTQEDIDIKGGVEFWFTPPPGGRAAKPYKQFLITLSVIFPLTIIVPWLLQPVFGWLPVLALPVIRHLVIAAAIVGIVVYAVMPRYTRLLSKWLYG
jgi:antibiotic biosynthesis monooxygenase (ABM) superfamily enzyme